MAISQGSGDMEELKITDVRRVFLDVLEERLTREAADRWAYSIIQKSEAGNIDFVPSTDREKIWSGIMYLYGIDSQDSPTEYLHSMDDIRNALDDKLG